MKKSLLVLIVLMSASCSTKRYYQTEEYKCERVCIDANKNYDQVKDPGCLCENKTSPE